MANEKLIDEKGFKYKLNFNYFGTFAGSRTGLPLKSFLQNKKGFLACILRAVII
jgi:Ran GTPase-activating protein (RanGAP) involved in mRNA processing and transport